MAETRVEGIKVTYEDRGKGEPVILLHGWNSSRKQWMHNIKALVSRFRVLAPDLPGHGESEEGEAFPYTLDGMSGFVEAFRRALYLPEFNLIGHSMGGCIALSYAAGRPDAIKSMVLVSTPTRTSSMGPRALIPGGEMFISLTYRYRSEKVLKWMFYRGVYQPERLDLDFVRANVKMAATIPRHVLSRSARMVRRVNLEEELLKASCPTLIVFGDKDRSVNPREALRQRNLLPDPYMTILTSCAHSPPYERPEIFNQLVRDFLLEKGAVRTGEGADSGA